MIAIICASLLHSFSLILFFVIVTFFSEKVKSVTSFMPRSSFKPTSNNAQNHIFRTSTALFPKIIFLFVNFSPAQTTHYLKVAFCFSLNNDHSLLAPFSEIV